MANPKRNPSKYLKRNHRPIKIDYKEIDRTIRLIEKCKSGFYDPTLRSYFVDGFEISERFLNDTLSKFSHYINVVSNMRFHFLDGSLESFIDSQKHIAEKEEEKEKLQKEHRKEFEKEIPIATDGDGNLITYD